MDDKLKALFEQNNGYLLRSQLLDKGTYNHLLSLVKAGVVDRVKQGVYHYATVSFDNTMIDVEKVIPGGVLCLYSAWSYYELSVQIPHSFNIAIEKSRKITLPVFPPIDLFYWKREYHELGIVEQEIDGYKVKIYNIEKSVCDAIKYRNKIGSSVTTEILKNYLKQKKRNLPLLMEYARKTRVEKILRTYMEMGL